MFSPEQLAAIAATNGRTVKAMCEKAGVAESTYQRWRSEKTLPTLRTYLKLKAAAEAPADAPLPA